MTGGLNVGEQVSLYLLAIKSRAITSSVMMLYLGAVMIQENLLLLKYLRGKCGDSRKETSLPASRESSAPGVCCCSERYHNT